MEYSDLNDYELVSYVMEGEEATDILFEKYKPLIHSIAKKIYQTNQNIGLDINDLISEGMIGFSIAINTYNEHKDTLFFTYAKKCIESKIYTLIKGANRQKHKLLNSSISVESLEEQFDFSLENVIGNKSQDPETIIIDNENVSEMIKDLKKEFTDFESQVFDLKKNGFGYKEIAEVLEVDSKKIDNAIQRIKTKIKNYLQNKDN